MHEDEDGDMLSNAGEYKLGRDPLVAESLIKPSLTSAGDQLRFSFTTRADRSEVNVVGQRRVPNDQAGTDWKIERRFDNWTNRNFNLTNSGGGAGVTQRQYLTTPLDGVAVDSDGYRARVYFDPAPEGQLDDYNVLFILVDDLNDWLSCMTTVDQSGAVKDGHLNTRNLTTGKTLTPHIDRLAARGTLFTNAHCSGVICGASRSSMLSGFRPFTNTIIGNAGANEGMRAFLESLQKPNLPEFFKPTHNVLGSGKIFHSADLDSWESFYPSDEHNQKPDGNELKVFFQNVGNVTAVLGSTTLTGTGTQFTQDVAVGMRVRLKDSDGNTVSTHTIEQVVSDTELLLETAPTSAGSELFRETRVNMAFEDDQFDWGLVDGTHFQAQTDYLHAMSDYQVATRIAGQLSSLQGRFFMGCGFFRPHLPFYAPEGSFDEVDALIGSGSVSLPNIAPNDLDDIPTTDQIRYSVVETDANGIPAINKAVADKGQHHESIRSYLACIHFMDQQVGRVLDALDASAHSRDTIIVLTSDHGWHHGQKQKWKKLSPWRDATRVPMIVVAPGITRGGSDCNHPVSLVDLYPTLANLATNSDVHEMDGMDLSSLLVDPDAPSEDSQELLSLIHI